MELGLTQIYTGDGKGKTTATIGMALRSLRLNFKVAVFQFMKGEKTGEIVTIEELGAEVHMLNAQNKFTWNMNEAELQVLRNECQDGLKKVKHMAASGEYDMIICDEIINAINSKLVSNEDVLDLIAVKNKHTELTLSGRNASPALMEAADLVSEIQCIKHPFEKGIPSRKGIEA